MGQLRCRGNGCVSLPKQISWPSLGWRLSSEAPFLLLPVTGRAQSGCTLAVEGSGERGVVMVNASGCAGDVAIIAKAGSNQKQFAIGSGEVYRPSNLTPCDLGIAGDKVSVTYTAVVVSGKDKGKTSAAYSGTIEPPPTPNDDAPPGVKVSGKPSPATYVRPGDTIALTVDLTDDIGLTAVKVIDPSGAIMLDQRIKPPAPGAEGCHERPPGQTATFSIPKPYTVPPNPATPSICFTAIARDTTGHETTAFADYWTEAVWAGPMTLAGSAHAGTDTCTTTWRVEVSVKATPGDAVSGHAEARHTPIVGCRYSWHCRTTRHILDYGDDGRQNVQAVFQTDRGRRYSLGYWRASSAGAAFTIAGRSDADKRRHGTGQYRPRQFRPYRGQRRFRIDCRGYRSYLLLCRSGGTRTGGEAGADFPGPGRQVN